MDGMSDSNWFAIQSKRFRESLAALSLRAAGHEVFLPLVKVECGDSSPIKRDSKALFTGYLFARFRPLVSLDAVESERGVLRVIKSGACPIPVEDQVIAELRERVCDDGLIRLCPREFKAGDRIAVQEGPFAGMVGRVEAELDDRLRVAILLESLWNARVLIEKRWIEAEAA